MVFQVVVRGYPPPSLTWYHQDTEVTADYSKSMELQKDGTLSITSTEFKHSGVYRLVAKNSGGSAEKEVKLTVKEEFEEDEPVEKERVEVKPVPASEFGEYVARGHCNSNEIFRDQYNVRLENTVHDSHM